MAPESTHMPQLRKITVAVENYCVQSFSNNAPILFYVVLRTS